LNELSFAIDLMILAAWIWLGWEISGALAARIPAGYRLAIAYPLGAGIYSFCLFIASWAGLGLNALSLGAIFLLLLAFVRWKERQQPSTGSADALTVDNAGRFEGRHILWLPVGAAILFVAGVAITRSYSSWDAAAIWAVKGYAIADEGSIFAGARWGAHGLSYPLNIPLLISVFRILEGDPLPGSKLIFVAFYVSLMAGCYRFWLDRNLSTLNAYLGVLLLATLPLLFEHGTIGYANLPMTTYVLMSVILGVQASGDARAEFMQLSLLLSGLAAWTRPEAVFLAPIVVLTFTLAIRVLMPSRPSRLRWALPGALVLILPQLFIANHGGEGVMTGAIQATAAAIGRGELRLDAVYTTIRTLGGMMLRPSIWGIVPAALILVPLANLPKLHPRRYPIPAVILAAACAAGLAIIAFYYLVAFTGDLRLWLDTGINRMFLPAGMLLLVWLITLTGEQERAQSR
jgi:hypothetical protein